MKCSYNDITDKLGEPLWWDEYGVPRYCEFTPRETANIYAKECCLLLIECQSCSKEFKVCLSQDRYQTLESTRSLSSYILDDQIHYGDPPNWECCAVGAVMNSVPIKILEYWERNNPRLEWTRDSKYEVPIDCEWALGIGRPDEPE